MCKSVYNGVNSVVRCYFLEDKITMWPEAWKTCESHGATLAQIHSTNEFGAISQYLSQRTPGAGSAVWYAFNKDPKDTNTGAEWFNKNESHWFMGPTLKNSKLSGANTYIRTHSKDITFRGGCLCGIIWPPPNYEKLVDNPCTTPWKPLCQISNPDQSYTYQGDKCVAEEVIKKSKGKSAKCCAKGCSKYEWCRSFNFMDDTKTCEYFPWSIKDGPKTKIDLECDHYSFDEF